MRTPVNRIKGKPLAETPEDLVAAELSKQYKVKRELTLEHDGKSFVAGILLPDQKLIVEISGKGDDKGIMAEMVRERIARGLGWRICRVRDTNDDVLYRVDREIRRG
jgi:very-short-patch-repair endonuclease